MSEHLLVNDHGPVRVLTLDRPESRNALCAELVRALYAAWLEADADPDVRVVVLTGTDPAFCAGVDLKEAATGGPDYFAVFEEADCINQAGRMRTPTIAAVNGAAFTGGLELALGCDFIVASERAVFADTHARVGVLPGGGLTARLPLVVGWANARRMSFIGEVVDAHRAVAWGLAGEVVAHDQLMRRTLELAAAMAEVDPMVLQAVKGVYREGWRATVDEALRVEAEMAHAHQTDYDLLDQRRRAVLTRNRGQLA